MAILDCDRPKKASFIKIRFLVVLMAILCPVVCYIARQNLSIAIVAMVKDANQLDVVADETVDKTHSSALPMTTTTNNQHNSSIIATITTINTNATITSNNQSHPHHHHQKQPTLLDSSKTCPPRKIYTSDGKEDLASKVVSYGPKYDWSSSHRSLIFEAFFWTYVLCQIPAARLAEVFGAKWILFTATFGSSLLSLISPWAASISPYAMAFIRALMGVSQTALYPGCYVLLTRWLPPNERSRAIPTLGAAAFIGSIITSIATGYFSEEKSFGWEYSFYLPCCLCAVWSIVWVFVGTSEPRQHKWISMEELQYIESQMEKKELSVATTKAAIDAGESNLSSNDNNNIKSISWKKLFKSQAIWALVAAFLASSWAFTIQLLLLPSYLNYVLLIPPFRNGIINSIIYVLSVISAPIIGMISALIIQSPPFGMTSLQIRKFFQTVAVLGQSTCFILMPILGCDTNLVLALLYTSIVIFSFVNGGEVQVPAELSLDFAGTIYAIGNCVGSTTGFLVPRVHSLIVDNYSDRSEWTLFLWISAVVTTLGGLVFLFMAKNELEDFSKDEPNSGSIHRYKANLECGLSMENYAGGVNEGTKIKKCNTKYVT